MLPDRRASNRKVSMLEEATVTEYVRSGSFGIRHLQILLLFLLTFVVSSTRNSFSIAIVAMVDNSTTANHNVPTYNWTNKNVILSSFFWGYILPQVGVAEVARKYGTKRILTICMITSIISCSLTPLIADRFGSYGVMVSRVILGLAQASTFPALYNILGHWAPPSERCFLGALANSGAVLGLITTLPITGFLCSSSWGWPSSFYFNSILGVIWIVLWFLLAADTPYDHRSISEAEKRYVTESLDHSDDQKVGNTPWKEISKSLPFWGIILCQLNASWGNNIFNTEMPSYISKVMKFDIKSNGVVSSLPYAVNFLLGFAFGYIADVIVNKQLLDRNRTRKLFVWIECVGPMLSLSVLSFLPDDDTILPCAMLILSQALGAAYNGGLGTSYVDISPNYCGIIMAISNAISIIPDIIAPLLVQAVVKEEHDKTQWRVIFLMAAAAYFFAGLVFALLGSAEVQPWDNLHDKDEVKEDISDSD